MARFDAVDPRADFPGLERDILAFWKDQRIFQRSLDQRADAPVWIFYEGPPTANGIPGVHHVESRTFKDIYPRFRTMTGHLVPRKAGWDCHGLPVELEVEKQIGTTGKRDIETFGVAAFNDLCRASVKRYVEEWARLTERIGFWIDMDEAYWTMSTEYIESVWWSLKQLHERGLLVEADKVTAYCPRCGTGLSDAEVAMGYRTVEDPSVFIKCPIVEASDEAPDRDLVGISLLVWTTTPWTLPSNAGVAVSESDRYAVVDRDGDRLILAEALVGRVLGEKATTTRTVRGADLVGARYEPPYPNVEGAHRVVAGDFVSMDDGTGIVHMAPAFGPEDLAMGKAQGGRSSSPWATTGASTTLHPRSSAGSS